MVAQSALSKAALLQRKFANILSIHSAFLSAKGYVYVSLNVKKFSLFLAKHPFRKLRFRHAVGFSFMVIELSRFITQIT